MPADQFLLKQGRRRPTERGFGSTQKPGDASADFVGDFELDPLTGYATPSVVLSMEDQYTIVQTDANWFESQPFLLSDGTYATAQSYRSSAAWTVATATPLPRGAGFYLGFIVYGNGAGAGTGPVVLTLASGQITIVLDRGFVTLARKDRPDSDATQLASAQLWHAEEWTGAGTGSAGVHYLYVYAVGDRLALRRLGAPGRPGRLALPEGLIATIPGVPAGGTALPSGIVQLSGVGFFCFGLAPERHLTSLTLLHRTINLPEPLSGGPTVEVDWLGPDGYSGPASGILSADGTTWGDEAPDPPYTALGYYVTALGLPATGPTLHVTRCRFLFPDLIEDDGLTGTDLQTLDPAGINGTGGVVGQVELRRGREGESGSARIDLLTQPDAVSAYVQPNMKGEWLPGGGNGAVLYTSRPSLRPSLHLDLLTLDAQSGWKRFQTARWAGEGSYGGKRLADAYHDIALKAGFTDEEIVIYEGGYELPTERPDGEPVLDFRPGQTLADILDYLRGQFSPSDLLTFDTAGKFWARLEPSEASLTVFTWDTADEDHAAVIAGTSTTARILDDWEEGWDESALVNDVWVVGRDRDGTPLVATATDWASVRDTDALNYVAGFQRMTIIDAELQTQAQVNLVARQVLTRLSRPRYTAAWSSVGIDYLYEGDLVEITGRGLWRLTGITRTWSLPEGPGRARYEAEYVEAVPA